MNGSRTEKPRSGAWLELAVPLLVFFACLFSIDPEGPGLRRENFVLDADIVPVAKVIATGLLRNVGRHPLYAMFLGEPGSLLNDLLHDVMLTGICFSAATAALASLVGLRFFTRLFGSRTDALWFCLLASFSASVWLFGSVPETHIFNYTAVVFAFWLLSQLGVERAEDRLGRTTLVAILATVFLMGITISNIVYVVLAVAVGLGTLPVAFAKRAKWLAVFLAGVVALFSAASALQLRLEPGQSSLLTDPAAPFDPEFFSWSRPLDLAVLGTEARMFLIDGMIAAPPEIGRVPTISGSQQMIQLGAVGASELVVLAWLVATVVLLASVRGTAPFGREGLLALLIVAFNFGLHYLFHGNGQPFIFSINTVFPLVVLLALVYRRSRVGVKRLVVAGLVAAVVVHNAWFMRSMNELVQRTCLVEKQERYRVCAVWWPTTSPRP